MFKAAIIALQWLQTGAARSLAAIVLELLKKQGKTSDTFAVIDKRALAAMRKVNAAKARADDKVSAKIAKLQKLIELV